MRLLRRLMRTRAGEVSSSGTRCMFYKASHLDLGSFLEATVSFRDPSWVVLGGQQDCLP